MTLVAGLLEAFFTERLQQQRNASPNTIAAYRDTFRLLLAFAQERLRKPPSALPLADLDATFVAAFLQHLEKQRRNSVRTRNARLAAIHSFFRYVALQEPAHSATCQRVLAIPTKKFERKLVTSLTRAEQEALIAAPDRTTWLGRRDHAIIILLFQTGLRVSELRDLRCEDIVLTVGAHVRCRGKGRKERCTPLTRETVSVIKAWLVERAGLPAEPTGVRAAPPRRTDGVLGTGRHPGCDGAVRRGVPRADAEHPRQADPPAQQVAHRPTPSGNGRQPAGRPLPSYRRTPPTATAPGEPS